MKKLFFILAFALIAFSLCKAQYIPFTNTIRIPEFDSGGIISFYKVPLPQAGYMDYYVQRSGLHFNNLITGNYKKQIIFPYKINEKENKTQK
jgi:hypothetical protein